MTAANRIVAVNRYYWPDYSATSQLLIDLAEHLAAHGQDTLIIASRQCYDDPSAKLPAHDVHNGVRICRVQTTRFGRLWLPGRALDYLTFYLASFIAILRETRPGDIVLAETDPPMISVIAWLAARLRGAILVNWCQDLFPEIAAALGMRLATGPLGGLARRLRNASLQGAHANVVLSEAMATHLQMEGLPSSRIYVIHNWPDRNIRPLSHERNRLRKEWGLDGNFTVAYSGNLGHAHAIEAVLTLVRYTADLPSLVWLFIGGGIGISRVKHMAQTVGLRNVIFKPYQPRSMLTESLSLPDLHLISVDPLCDHYLMPSKIYGILAAGRPMLALVAPDGPVARLVRKAEIGAILDIAQPCCWREQVKQISTGHGCRLSMGTRARRLFEAEFDGAIALGTWLDLLTNHRSASPSQTSGKRPT